MSGAETSGSDAGRAASAFSDASGQVEQQAGKVTSSAVTAKKAGRKFHEAGQAYQDRLNKLGKNISSYAGHGVKLADDFRQTQQEYQSSDQTGADHLRGVEA